jgi:hypothetical protein
MMSLDLEEIEDKERREQIREEQRGNKREEK